MTKLTKTEVRDYKNMDKASYIKEAKRQNAVHTKTGKWDVKDSSYEF